PPSSTLFPYTTLFRSAADVDRIEIAHQHDRRFAVALAELAHEVEYRLHPDPAGQGPFGAALDHRAVGHRVGERHPELDQVGARRSEEHTSELQSRENL